MGHPVSYWTSLDQLMESAASEIERLLAGSPYLDEWAHQCLFARVSRVCEHVCRAFNGCRRSAGVPPAIARGIIAAPLEPGGPALSDLGVIERDGIWEVDFLKLDYELGRAWGAWPERLRRFGHLSTNALVARAC